MSCLPWPFEEKFLERVLRDCEDELTFLLCRVDPVELCENFFERSVISRESYNHFTSMDHSRIKSRLRLRYLVRLVSVKIKKDPALWENLIAVLDTLEGVPSSLTDKLKQAVLNTNEGLADDSEAVGSVSGASLGEASENEEVVLTTGDVNFLTELLTEVRDKWYEIAISLGLLQHEIADCEGKNNKISLFQILGFWIANNSEPTLKKLTDTLCSEIVARTAAAEKVTRKFMEAKKMSKSNKKRKTIVQSKSPMSNITPTTPRIVSQSLPIKVADGKSTLLQVQASPRESVYYQWKKDGQPLANSTRYSGVDEDILVVRHACQGTEGEYTCQVSLQDKQESSEPITLTVHFPLAKRHLLNLYSTVSEVPTLKGSWPPVVSKSFINLALIKSSRAQKMTGDYSVRGDADDIIAEKENITYKDAFSEYKSGELILVEGRPGSGKTTLAHKIIKDWRLGEVLTKSELTFLVTLRLLNSKGQDESLENILQDIYSHNSELETTVSNILEMDGEGVCFVLDGLDEYSSNKEISVILKLLHRKLLPRSMIIVFSRPSATGLINRDCIAKHIEVFGFRKEQISEYIDSFPFEIKDGSNDNSIIRASQLKEYLHSHPNIHDMCYLPIHAAMISFLLQLSKTLSPTQTRVYEEFTLCIIYRFLTAQGDCLALKSLKDLKGAHAQYFEDLCRLAYEMTIKSKQVISSQELEDWLGDRGSFSEVTGLGLLTICPTLQKTGIHQNYAFLHLTFQEFLAAYYIANYLDESQQIQLLEGHSHCMRTVWRFYSGLVDFEHSVQILHHCFNNLGEYGEYEIFHCALESQQKFVCNELINYKSQQLQFHEELNPTDLQAVGYVVTNSSQPITYLGIDNPPNDIILHLLTKIDLQHLLHISIRQHSIDDKLTEDYCKLLKEAVNLENIQLCVRQTLSSSAAKLAKQIKQFNKLLLLNVSYIGTPECIQTFLGSLSIRIPELKLEFYDLSLSSFQALRNGLQIVSSNCLCLGFVKTCISEESMTILLDGLQNFQSLQLNFFKSEIDRNGFNYLSRKLKDIQIQSLNLIGEKIGNDGITALAGGFEFWTVLQRLGLPFNEIGPDGATTLAGGFKFMTALQKLDLSYNNIGSDGATALAREFKFLTELQCLNVSCNNISSDGVIALAGGLHCLTKLKYCDIEQKDSDDGFEQAFTTIMKKFDHFGETMFELKICCIL